MSVISQFRTSLVIQWLRLCPSNAKDEDSIPGRGTKIPHVARPVYILDIYTPQFLKVKKSILNDKNRLKVSVTEEFSVMCTFCVLHTLNYL